jgi:thiol-disulfide isomerase/thioredoxin
MSRSLLLIACLAAPFAAAAPTECPLAGDRWVAPQAQTVLDRLDAAYAGLEGWTSTFTEAYDSFAKGSGSSFSTQITDRYFRGSSSIPCFTFVNYVRGELGQLMTQNPEERFMIMRAGKDQWVGKAVDPVPDPGPMFKGFFRNHRKEANFIGYGGKESVAGRECDVLELTLLTPGVMAEGGPTSPRMTNVRCYVDPDGFIQRLVTNTSSKDGAISQRSDMRVTALDARAKFTAAEFTRAAFEREATALLQGTPMPKLEEVLFKPGGSLPPATFTAWADKKPFQISDLKGKVVVLETWASWCYYCKQAFPFYEKIRQKLADQDVVFVAVSFDQKQADYEKWMNTHAGSYGFKFGRIVSENPIKALDEFKGSLPGFYVLGRDGKIVASYNGFGYNPGQEDPRLVQALRAAGVKL